MTQSETDDLKAAISDIRTDVAVIKTEMIGLKTLPAKVDEVTRIYLTHPQECLHHMSEIFLRKSECDVHDLVTQEEFRPVELWVTWVNRAIITALIGTFVALVFKVAQALQ